MKVKSSRHLSPSDKYGAIVIFMHEKSNTLSGVAKDLNESMGNELQAYRKSPEVSDKAGDITIMHAPANSPYQRIVFARIGDKTKASVRDFRSLSGSLVRLLDAHKVKTAAFLLPSQLPSDASPEGIAQAVGEGLTMGRYTYTALKSDPVEKKHYLQTLTLSHDMHNFTDQAFQQGVTIAEGVCLARDVTNAPANVITPEAFVDVAKKHFKSGPVKLSLIDKKKAKKLGMNAFLGVAQGSLNDPYLLILTYEPVKKQKPIALVGKGVTFDTGGISIKPSNKMSEMKGDMGGAAAVLGTMLALKTLKPKQNVTAYIPLVENMPSAMAQRPGDVVKAFNGKTIEILNTDAEGRLIMADALSYAVQQGAKEILDIATLTGAALVALGTCCCAIMSNTDNMVDRMKAAAAFTGDKVWQLPLFDEYLKLLDSDTADLSNCYEGRYGGTCSAGKFLEQFVDDTPWLHVDMAPLMTFDKTAGHRIKGMSGVGVQNFVEYILNAAS